MATAAPNERLAALMREADCSNKRLARLVRELGRRDGKNLGTDHTAVSRWLTGRVRSPHVAGYIAEALGTQLGRYVTLEDIGFGHTVDLPPDLGQTYPSSVSECAAALAQLWQADTDQRAMLDRPAQGTVWHDVSLTWLVSPPGHPQSATGNRAVGTTDVEAFRVSIDLFSQLDGTYGGGYARAALIAYLNGTLAPLLGGTFTETVGRTLFATAAEATLLAAWMSYDAGRHGLAQRYFVQAIGLAEASGDRTLAGTVLSAMSHQATYLGQAWEGANLARAALLGTTGQTTATQRAQIYAMEARALARTGDVRECDHALAEATTALEKADADAPAWVGYFDERELYAEIGHCFRDLGRTAAAAWYAEQAVNGGCGPRSDFFAEMVAADAHRAEGDYEHATSAALHALRLGERLDSWRCLTYVEQFRQQLPTDDTSPVLRDFMDQVANTPLWQRVDQGQ